MQSTPPTSDAPHPADSASSNGSAPDTDPAPDLDTPAAGTFTLKEAREVWQKEARGTAAEGLRVGSREFLNDLGESIGQNPPDCIPTPFETLDFACGGRGLPVGYTHILSGPSGFGKSLEAVKFVNAATAAGHTSAIVSGEMGAKENIARMLAPATGTDYELINPYSREYSVEAWKQAVNYYLAHDRALFWVNEEANIRTLEDALACVNFAAQKGGAEFIMVDYAQYFTVASASNKKEQVDTVAQEMDRLAKDLNVCVLLLSQLRRSSYTNGSVPGEQDQEYSHGLTKDARTVTILDPTLTNERPNGDKYYRINLAKNRGGKELSWCVQRHYQTLRIVERPDYRWCSDRGVWAPKETVQDDDGSDD